MVNDNESIDIRDTIKTLMQLDEKSLILINNGAKMLVARQEIDKLDKDN